MAALTEKTAEDLIAAAQLGLKVKPKDRLAAIVYLERTGKIEEYKEKQLADIFKVSIAAIARDRAAARQMFAEAISADEAMNYMAEFVRNYDILIAEARKALKQVEPGMIAHQSYLRILADLWDKKIDRLQGIGVIPKELGRLTTIKEEWIAEAAHDTGVVSVRQAEADKDANAA